MQERDRERRNCSLPPEYDTPSTILGMPDLIPTAKNKGSQEFYLIFPAFLRYPYRYCEQSFWYFFAQYPCPCIGNWYCTMCSWYLNPRRRVSCHQDKCHLHLRYSRGKVNLSFGTHGGRSSCLDHGPGSLRLSFDTYCNSSNRNEPGAIVCRVASYNSSIRT